MKLNRGSIVIAIVVLLVVCFAAGIFIIMSKKEEEVVTQGMDYFQQKQYEAQLEDCLKVIEADPNYTLAYYNAACCYSQLFKKKKAMEMLEKALQLDKMEDHAYGLIDNAAKDQDFANIKDDAEFILLLQKYR